MDNWETKMSLMLQADQIDLYHLSTSTSTDGASTIKENYLQLDIYNSKVLEQIDFNERVLVLKCDEIRDSVLKYSSLNELPGFHELRLKLIKKKGFFIFKSEKEKIITYSSN